MTTNVIKITLGLLTTCALAHAQIVRDDSKEVATDTETGLMWQDNEEAKTVEKNWADAKTYCENLTLGGYHDWFLPTVDELLTLAVDTRVNPAIQEGFKYVGGSVYWSSSPYLSVESFAWDVSFDDGSTCTNNEASTYRVRCARDSTGTSSLLAAHNAKLAKVDKTIKIAQAKQAQEQKIREERQAQEEMDKLSQKLKPIITVIEEDTPYTRAQERQRLIQEKNRKSAESVKNFVDGIVSLSKGVNDAMENTAAKFYGLTPDQCKRVKIYYGTSNIGRRYKVLQGVSNGSKFDFQCTAAQIGATAIINANANCSRAAVVKRGWFSNSIENEETCTYTGTAVQ